MAFFVTTASRNRGDEDETPLSPAIEVIPEEQERYEALGREFSRKLFGDYKAAGKNPYEYGLMIEDPYHPYIMPSPFPSLMKGWRWPNFEEPLKNRLKRSAGTIADIVDTSFGTYAISQRVIDIIESIEPGVHQYLPYELIQPDGSVHPDKRWLLNVCTRAETIDYEKSNVIAVQKAPHFIMDRTTDYRLVLRKEAVAGRALWYEYRYQGTSRAGAPFLLSDRFWDALNEAGCAGWQPKSFAYGEHIEEL